MKRVIFQNVFVRNTFFKECEYHFETKIAVASFCHVHIRTYRGWRCGKHTLPFSVYQKIITTFNFGKIEDIEIFDEIDIKREAGRLGGKKVQQLYGNPGTKEGRSRGGRNAIQSMKLKYTDTFQHRKVIKGKGEYTKDLAELIGILLGDGGISDYQVHVFLHSETDKEYAQYVCGLYKILFDLTPVIIPHARKKVNRVRVSRRDLVEYLISLGLVVGDKVRQQVEIPNWIKINTDFMKHCVRGLVDTDGCVYIDKHVYSSKIYHNICVAFTNNSIPLRNAVFNYFVQLGLHPTISRNNVLLRRVKEIQTYFEVIGSSNPKHFNKYLKFMEEYQSGRNGAVSKAACL